MDTLAAVRDRCSATCWARSKNHGPLSSCAPWALCHDHVFSFQNSPDLVHRSWRRGYETGQSASQRSLLESFISAYAFPVRVFRTAFMAWHSRRPLSATVHYCFSIISHENRFNWCLLSDLRCRLSLFTWGSALRLRTGFVHLYLCRTFCVFSHEVLHNSFTI